MKSNQKNKDYETTLDKLKSTLKKSYKQKQERYQKKKDIKYFDFKIKKENKLATSLYIYITNTKK